MAGQLARQPYLNTYCTYKHPYTQQIGTGSEIGPSHWNAAVCAKMSGLSMPAAAAAHATPKDLKGHGNRNSTLVSLNSWGVSRQLWQFQQPQHGTAAWASWLHSCCGTLPSQASLAPPSASTSSASPALHHPRRSLPRTARHSTAQSFSAAIGCRRSNVESPAAATELQHMHNLVTALAAWEPEEQHPCWDRRERVFSPGASAEEPRFKTD